MVTLTLNREQYERLSAALGSIANSGVSAEDAARLVSTPSAVREPEDEGQITAALVLAAGVMRFLGAERARELLADLDQQAQEGE